MMRNWLLLFLLFCTLPLQAGVRGDLRKSGQLYKQQKYGQALAGYNRILQNTPQQEEAAFGAGSAAYYLKDYTAAQKAFSQVAQQNGLRGQDALFNLGNTYYRAGQKEKAVESYRQAILKNPNDKEAVHNLQLILSEKNNPDNPNKNQNNPDDKSPNQNPSNGQNSTGADQPQPQESSQTPQEKESAERVMQMARENEYKRAPQPGTAQDNLVEKDW